MADKSAGKKPTTMDSFKFPKDGLSQGCGKTSENVIRAQQVSQSKSKPADGKGK